MVNMTLRILSKPSEAKLANIFKTLGTDWEERVLPSIGNEVVKAVVAQYNAEQLLTQRDKVRDRGADGDDRDLTRRRGTHEEIEPHTTSIFLFSSPFSDR
jgi:hypothetical protein